ncbi:unnamed protein product [Soboliphyme baturini]|uniref:PHD finger protein 10 n=1 Tax=Soboliphyme baturini TaxID=241478 RepID=A0A183IF91_9BILA|nr:unnamed protein product [Soboliphyme baturini]
MLMENVSDYLGVRNLTRKYPTLSKRFVSGDELYHLINIGIIDKSLRDISLTALVAKEVLTLMSVEYPDRFLIKADSSKYAELRERVMHSVAEWNSELCRERNRGKRCFFDIQTMVVQRPRPPTVCVENPVVDPYPATILEGQFNSYFKKYAVFLKFVKVLFLHPICRYSTEELFALPLNTVIRAEDYFPNAASRSPPPITVHPSELQLDLKEDIAPPSLKHVGSRTKIRKVSSSSDIGAEDSRGEDKMLFCDKCDRGYHTFCVGLSELPSGRWICPKYCMKAVHQMTAGNDSSSNQEIIVQSHSTDLTVTVASPKQTNALRTKRAARTTYRSLRRSRYRR